MSVINEARVRNLGAVVQALPAGAYARVLGCVAAGVLRALGREDEPAVAPVLASLAAGKQGAAGKQWGAAQLALKRAGAFAEPAVAQLLECVGLLVRAPRENVGAHARRFYLVWPRAAAALVATGAAYAEDVHLRLAACVQPALSAAWDRPDDAAVWRFGVLRAVEELQNGSPSPLTRGWDDSVAWFRHAGVVACHAALPAAVRAWPTWQTVLDLDGGYVQGRTTAEEQRRVLWDAVGIAETAIGRQLGNIVNMQAWTASNEAQRDFAMMLGELLYARPDNLGHALRAACRIAARVSVPEGWRDEDWGVAFSQAMGRAVAALAPFKPDVLTAAGG